ncbi:MAG: hypothetical protein H6732_04555 [Alphaproteobacteria bacterium]|nr:hypothetical protein [Alphaproteobacteria bacterium]
MKRLLFEVGFLLLMVCVALLTGEVAVRVVHPTPRRVVVVETPDRPFQTRGGVTVWPDTGIGGAARRRLLEDADCALEGAFRVVIAGDSIFNGIGVPAPEVGSVVAKARLREAHPDLPLCVVNLSVPGFSLYQMVARLESRLDDLRPHLVIFQLWSGPPRWPVRLGDRVVMWEGDPADPDLGNPYGLPRAWHAWLFQHSRLYGFAVVAAPADASRPLDLAPHRAFLDRAVEEVEAVGGEAVTVMAAQPSHPWDAQPPALATLHAAFEPWIDAHALQNVRMSEAFAGLDHSVMGLDEIHLNAVGHQALAGLFVDLIEPRLVAWAQEREGTPEPTTP